MVVCGCRYGYVSVDTLLPYPYPVKVPQPPRERAVAFVVTFVVEFWPIICGCICVGILWAFALKLTQSRQAVALGIYLVRSAVLYCLSSFGLLRGYLHAKAIVGFSTLVLKSS